MARISANVSDEVVSELRHYLINTNGSTRGMGDLLEEMIREGLEKRRAEVATV
jgi:hypothetical protein